VQGTMPQGPAAQGPSTGNLVVPSSGTRAGYDVRSTPPVFPSMLCPRRSVVPLATSFGIAGAPPPVIRHTPVEATALTDHRPDGGATIVIRRQALPLRSASTGALIQEPRGHGPGAAPTSLAALLNSGNTSKEASFLLPVAATARMEPPLSVAQAPELIPEVRRDDAAAVEVESPLSLRSPGPRQQTAPLSGFPALAAAAGEMEPPLRVAQAPELILEARRDDAVAVEIESPSSQQTALLSRVPSPIVAAAEMESPLRVAQAPKLIPEAARDDAGAVEMESPLAQWSPGPPQQVAPLSPMPIVGPGGVASVLLSGGGARDTECSDCRTEIICGSPGMEVRLQSARGSSQACVPSDALPVRRARSASPLRAPSAGNAVQPTIALPPYAALGHDESVAAAPDGATGGGGVGRVEAPIHSSRRGPQERRYEKLYEDAVARRQRQRDHKDWVEKSWRQAFEDDRRDFMLRQRQRQRYYHFRDTRTHDEREEEILRRREEHARTFLAKGLLREENELALCTFRPALSSRRQQARPRGSGGGDMCGGDQLRPDQGMARSSSCGANRSPTAPKENRPKLWSPASVKLQKLFERQLAVVRKLGLLDADVALQRNLMRARYDKIKVRVEREHGLIDGSPLTSFTQDHVHTRVVEVLGPEQRAAEVRLYRRQLDLVHALERLDGQALALPKADLESLLVMGYRLRLADERRAAIQVPNGQRSLETSGDVASGAHVSFESGNGTEDDSGRAKLDTSDNTTSTTSPSRRTSSPCDGACTGGAAVFIDSPRHHIAASSRR